MQRCLAFLALASLGCGQSHDPDAGVDAGPRILGSCEEFLEAEDGAFCEDIGRSCGEPGWCPRDFVRCADGYITRELFDGPYEDPADDPRSCPRGTADVTAGELRFDDGVVQVQDGFVQELTVVLTAGAPFYECSFPFLVTRFGPAPEGYEGTLETAGRLAFEDHDVEIRGTVTVLSYEAPPLAEDRVLEATLSMSGTGPSGSVQVDGSFALSECRPLYIHSI